MNRSIIRRWINEYLDGEIGLADKAELERLFTENPQLRKEYKDLRLIGLYLGYMPEVQVHPQRFRQRVMAALDTDRGYFTPQRAFSMAMLVFLIVIGVTFGLFVYQQQMLSSKAVVGTPTPLNPSVVQGEYRFDLVTGVSADAFLNRLALESQFGMTDNSLLSAFVSQTRVFEGATCDQGGGLHALKFPATLPPALIVRVSPQQALALAALAGELSGARAVPCATSPRGETLDLKTYITSHPGDELIPLRIAFK